jgi:CPA2 family monovalent cation:H+ antiporter-2
MHDLAPLIKDLAIMLGVASVVILLFQRIRQPVVLGYLVAGIIIGPYTPPHALVSDIPNIQILSELGVIFLMFSLGLDFSFHKLVRVGFSASLTGLVEVILMALLGFTLGHFMHWSFYDCLFLGGALAISSTTIIIKALDELNLKSKRFAELIFGILVIEDLLAILLLVALSTMVVTKNIVSMAMLYATIKLFLVVGGWFLVGYFLMPPLFRRIAQFLSAESLTVLSIALCLILVFIATRFHYSTALGAFIMGSILAETLLVHRIEQLIRPVRDIFAAVFFITVGMLIDPYIILHEWRTVLLISAVTVVGKVLTTGIGALLTGQSLNTSVRVGFGMSQIGEFSFIIAGLGLALNATSQHLYPIIVAVSAVTTFTTPYLIRFSAIASTQLEKMLSPRLRFWLDSYSTWVYRAQASKGRGEVQQHVLLKLIINGAIVAIIFSLCGSILLPRINDIVAVIDTAKLITWIIALFASSPFIWGMLISYQSSHLKKHHDPRFLSIVTVAIVLVIILSLAYFHNWLVNGLLISLMIVFFALTYKKLEKSYHWFEHFLIQNLKKENSKSERYEQLAPWDTHFIEMIVGHGSSIAGKPLKDTQPLQQFGINIVAIQRGDEVILAPRGNEKILPFDKLVVLGSDDQIEGFKAVVETEKPASEENDLLASFMLKSVVLDKTHLLVNQTIGDSQIREQVGGLVVGLERRGSRILNPDHATKLQAGDLLLVVGPVTQLKEW